MRMPDLTPQLMMLCEISAARKAPSASTPLLVTQTPRSAPSTKLPTTRAPRPPRIPIAPLVDNSCGGYV